MNFENFKSKDLTINLVSPYVKVLSAAYLPLEGYWFPWMGQCYDSIYMDKL